MQAFKKYRDGIELIPMNTSYEPKFYTDKEVEEKPVICFEPLLKNPVNTGFFLVFTE